jgi:hypothetical protein
MQAGRRPFTGSIEREGRLDLHTLGLAHRQLGLAQQLAGTLDPVADRGLGFFRSIPDALLEFVARNRLPQSRTQHGSSPLVSAARRIQLVGAAGRGERATTSARPGSG